MYFQHQNKMLFVGDSVEVNLGNGNTICGFVSAIKKRYSGNRVLSDLNGVFISMFSEKLFVEVRDDNDVVSEFSSKQITKI